MDISQYGQLFANLSELGRQQTPNTPNLSNAVDYYSLAGAKADMQGLSEVESDLLNLTANELSAKYGPDVASRLIRQKIHGATQYAGDYTAKASPLQTAKDFALGGLTGFASGLGALASTPFAAVGASNIAGAAGATANAVSDLLQSGMSDEAKRNAMAQAARSKQIDREGAYIEQKAKEEGESSFMASLDRLGSEALRYATDVMENPDQLLPITAQGVGSLFAGGIAGAGAKAIAQGAVKGAAKLGATPNSLVGKAANTMDKYSWWAGTGALEGGSTYNETYADIMSRTTDDLMKLPTFAERVEELKARGLPLAKAIQEAKKEFAGDIAWKAGTAAAASGVALGKFSKWAENPLSVGIVRDAIKNIGSETLEETLQSFNAKVAQNLAIQHDLDRNQSLVEGLANETIQGALGGALSAGSLGTVSAGLKGIGNITSSARDYIANKKSEQIVNQAQAQQQAQQVQQQQTVQQPQATTETTQVTEEPTTVNNGATPTYSLEEDDPIKAISEAMRNTDKDQLEDAGITSKKALNSLIVPVADLQKDDSSFLKNSNISRETKVEVLSNSFVQATDESDPDNSTKMVNRVKYMKALFNAFKTSQDETEKKELAKIILKTSDQFFGSTKSESLLSSEAINALPDGNAFKQLKNTVTSLKQQITEDESFKQVYNSIVSDFETTQNSVDLSNETATEEQVQSVANSIVNLAKMDLSKVNEKQAAQVYKAISLGKANVSEEQKNVLKVLDTFFKVRKSSLERKKAKSQLSAIEEVSENIFTSDDPEKTDKTGKYSLEQRMTRGINAYLNGDMDTAKAEFEHILKLQVSLNSKLGALQLSASNNGKEMPYISVNPNTGAFYKAPGKVKANLSSESSRQFVRAVESDLKDITDLYNVVSDSFKDLGLARADSSSLADKDFQNALKDSELSAYEQVNSEWTKAGKSHPMVPGVKAARQTKSKKAKRAASKTKKTTAKSTSKTTKSKAKTETTKKSTEPTQKTAKESLEETIENRQEELKLSESGSTDAVPKTTNNEGTATANKFDTLKPRKGIEHLHKDRFTDPVLPEDTIDDPIQDKISALKQFFDKWNLSSNQDIYRNLTEEQIKDLNRLGLGDLVKFNVKNNTYFFINNLGKDNGNFAEYATNISDKDTFANKGKVYSVKVKGTNQLVRVIRTEDDNTVVLNHNGVSYVYDLVKLKTKHDADKFAPKFNSIKDIDDRALISSFFNDKLSFDSVTEFNEESIRINPMSRDNFSKIFRFPKNKEPNLTNPETIVEDIDKILSNQDELNKYLPSDSVRALTQEPVRDAYRRLLKQIVPLLIQKMQENLANYLNASTNIESAEYPGTKYTNQEALIAGVLKSSQQGHHIANFLVQNPDGTLSYDEKFLKLAVLSAVNSLISTGNKSTRQLTAEEAAEFLGVEESSITEDILNKLNYSHDPKILVNDFARTLEQFLGVQISNDAPIGQSTGSIQALAANLLTALNDLGYIKTEGNINIITVEPKDKKGKAKSYIMSSTDIRKPSKTYRRFKINIDTSAVSNNRRVLEQIIVKEPGLQEYYQDDEVPVANHVMHEDTPLVKPQTKALESLQKKKHFINTLTFGPMLALGIRGILSFLNLRSTNNSKLFNKNYREIQEARARAIESSFERALQLLEQFEAISKALNIPIDQVAKKYQYGITSPNRFQSMEAHDPISDKFTREIIKATVSNTDLTNPEELRKFKLALAQRFGVNIANNDHDTALAQVDEILARLDGEVVDHVIDLIEKYSNTDVLSATNRKSIIDSLGEEEGEYLRKAIIKAGAGSTDVRLYTKTVTLESLHALLEYANYVRLSRKNDTEALKNYKSMLYIELDASASGNTMCIFHFAGLPTFENLVNLARSGFSFGKTLIKSALFKSKEVDKTDMYKESTKHAAEELRNLRTILSDSTTKTFDSIIRVFEILKRVDGILDAITDSDSEVRGFNRELLKKLATMLPYGSGSRSAAEKEANLLIQALYALLSEMNVAQANNPSLLGNVSKALFPELSQEDADAKLRQFKQDINQIFNTELKVKYEDPKTGEVKESDLDDFSDIKSSAVESVEIPKGKNSGRFSLDYALRHIETFTITEAQRERLTKNIHQLLVKPMLRGVKTTLGKDVIQSMEDISTVSNIAAVAYRVAFEKAKNELLEKWKLDNGNVGRKKFENLSPNELKQLRLELAHLVTKYTTEYFGHTYIKTRYLDELATDDSFALKGQESFHGYTESARIKQPGVSSLSKTVQGSGDGTMMEFFATMEESIKNELVFDGTNSPFTDILATGEAVNSAVAKSADVRPYKHLRITMGKILENFAKNPRLFSDIFNNTARRGILSRAIFPDAGYRETTPKKFLPSADELTKKMVMIYNRMVDHELKIEARFYAFEQVGWSVDHMAGAEKPWQSRKAKTSELSLEEAIKAIQTIAYKKYLEDRPKAKFYSLKSNFDEDGAGLVKISYDDLSLEHQDLLSQDARYTKKELKKDFREKVKEYAIPAQTLEELGIRTTPLDIVTYEGNSLAQFLDSFSQGVAKPLHQLLDGIVKSGVKVHIGSKQELANLLADQNKANAIESLSPGQKGWYDGSTNEIYILTESNPTGVEKAETVLHELIHANTVQTIEQYYVGKTDDKATKKTFEALEIALQQFIDNVINDNSLFSLPKSVKQTLALPEVLNLVEDPETGLYSIGDTSPEAKSLRMAEFIAYALSNPMLIEKASGVKNKAGLVTRLANIFKLIKDFIFGNKMPPLNTLYDSIKFGATVLSIKNDPSIKIEKQFSALSLNSSSPLIARTDTLIPNLMAYRMSRRTSNKEITIPRVQVKETERDMRKIFARGEKNLVDAEVAGFTFDSVTKKIEFKRLFNVLTTAEARSSKTTPYSNKLFEYTIRQLEAKDPDHKLLTKSQFDYLKGLGVKNQNEPTATFIALLRTNSQLREAVSTLKLPETKGNSYTNSLDVAFENFGNNMLDKLESSLTEVNKNNSVISAVDTLIDTTFNELEQMTAAEAPKSFVLSSLDALNKKVKHFNIEALRVLADKINRLIPESTKTENIKMFLSNIVDRQATFSNSALKTIRSGNISVEWAKFFTDLFGFDDASQNVLSIIKRAKGEIQRIRQYFRKLAPAKIKDTFSAETTKEDYRVMQTALGKTDLVALDLGDDESLSVLKDQRVVENKIRGFEQELAVYVGNDSVTRSIIQKAKELAKFNVTGEPSKNLLRNSYAIGSLFGYTSSRKPKSNEIAVIDKLISLYSLKELSDSDKASIKKIAEREPEGIKTVLGNLRALKDVEESKKVSRQSKINHWKGYLPNEVRSSQAIEVVQKNSERYHELVNLGYQDMDVNDLGFATMYLPINIQAIYNEGGIQYVTNTYSGIVQGSDKTIGNHSLYLTTEASRKPEYDLTKAETIRLLNSPNALPIYNTKGKVVAFEIIPSQKVEEMFMRTDDIAESIGVYFGRQQEEQSAQGLNTSLVKALHTMYHNANTSDKTKQYLNVFELKDPSIQESLEMMSPVVKNQISNLFGDKFMVRRDLVLEVLGQRTFSIGKLFTNKNQYNNMFCRATTGLFDALFGKNAYKNVLYAEQAIQKGAATARNIIVVRSGVVNLLNMASTLMQLAYFNISPIRVVKEAPKYIYELETYIQKQKDIVSYTIEKNKARTQAEKQKYDSYIKRAKAVCDGLSIAPLIKAGEFSSIADVGLTTEDINFGNGKYEQKLNDMYDSLPESAKNLGKYLLLTKGNPLHSFLTKTVQYNDFIAKAILYNKLRNEDKMSPQRALAIVRDEFVNYDLQTGRLRGYLESVGLLWFYNYKLRIARSAYRAIKHNPLMALLVMSAGMIPGLDGVGTPFSDNVLSKLIEGNLMNSIGPGMMLESPFMLPTVALFE